MRYYKIIVSDPKTGEVFVPVDAGKHPAFKRVARSQAASTYTSLNPGASAFTIGGTNPAALAVSLDIVQGVQHMPNADSFVRVQGVGLGTIGQAANLNGMNIAVFGGMARGLPLAKPEQSGLLVGGMIRSSFGNWTGTDQALNLYMQTASSPSSNQTSGNAATAASVPLPSTNEDPANIVWQWTAGQQFKDAVVTALSRAFPKNTIKLAVSPNLAWTSGSADTGYFATLRQFAEYLNSLSRTIVGGAIPSTEIYLGVSISLNAGVFRITDGTQPTTAKAVSFFDLIGQPTWVGPTSVQAVCTMRADISPNDYVTLPPLVGTTTAASASQTFNIAPGSQYSTAASGSIFSGTFLVNAIRHVGDSRQADGMAWVTTLDLGSIGQGATANAIPDLPTVYAGSNNYGFYLP